MKHIRLYTAALFTALSLLCAPILATAQEEAQEAVATVNINSATAEELAEKLAGIGTSRAELIIQYRDENGAFTSAEQLLEVKGIGQATLNKNLDKIEL